MHYVIIAVIVGLATAFWARVNYRRPPDKLSTVEGSITPGKISAAAITLLGVALAILGLASLLNGVAMPGVICSAIGIALAAFMSPSLVHIHDVSWDMTGVNGPCRLFGPTLGRPRTHIRWEDITAAGKTATSYWFIQSNDGRRVYWSYLYPGYGHFVENIRSRLPHLTLPDDLR